MFTKSRFYFINFTIKYTHKAMRGVYVTIDFEAVNQKGVWLCYCIMVSEYPRGKVIEFHQGRCDRSDDEYDEITKQFWENHSDAYHIIKSQYQCLPINDANKLLCSRISDIVSKYERAYFVSDNPQFDLKILDNILTSNGYDPVSRRSENLYLQCVCTWSFQLSILSLLGFSPIDIDKFLIRKGLISSREIDNYFGPRHTPRSDCAKILCNHFKILDIIDLYKLRIKHI